MKGIFTRKTIRKIFNFVKCFASSEYKIWSNHTEYGRTVDEGVELEKRAYGRIAVMR